MEVPYLGDLWQCMQNESCWFPTGINGERYTLKDLQTNTAIPKLNDLHWSIVFGLMLVLGRYIMEKFITIPLGYALGVSRKRMVRVEPNPVLEAAYKSRGKIDNATYLKLSKQLDMPQRQIEIWFRKRHRNDTPPQMLKFCDCSWHLIFYSIAFTYGVVILWDKPWAWDTKQCWNGWPNQDVTADMYWYFMVELSFYWSLVFTLLTDHKRTDFWQYIVHHVATISLIYISWAGNYNRMGSLILMLHDAADPWMAIAKMGVYVKKKPMTDVCFVVFLVVWIVSRLIYYPFWIIYSMFYEILLFNQKRGLALNISIGFLLALMTLHLIWSYSIWKILYNTLVKGTLKDTRSDSEGDVEYIEENDNIVTNGNTNGNTSVTNGNSKHNRTNSDHSNGSCVKNGAGKTNGHVE